MIKAYLLGNFGQSVLDFGIKMGVGAVIVGLNLLIANLSNGAWSIPENYGGAITLGIISYAVSQLDVYVVAWQAKNDPAATVDTIPPAAIN
jgi:hypothetical protein